MTVPAIFQPLGAMTAWLAILIALWDIQNEFLPVLCATALVLLGIGIAWE